MFQIPEYFVTLPADNLYLILLFPVAMTHTPKVSIITIGRNNREGYARTLESVVTQTCRDYEWIVIDGASTDGSVELLREHEAEITRLVSEPDTGIFNAMNKGIALARGEYCNFMNSGDAFHAPDVLERAVPRLQGKDFYVGHQVSPNGRPAFLPAPREVTAYALVNKALTHQGAFIRTELLKVRPFNEKYTLVADREQMVYEMLVGNASYERLDFVVADFDGTGVSGNPAFKAQYNAQWDDALHTLFSPRVADLLCGGSRFQRKVRYALEKENLAERDWKILRNALKALPGDLWKSLTRRKKG